MKLKCQACDYQGYPVEFIIKPIKTTMGHKHLPHCPKCNSAMVITNKRILAKENNIRCAKAMLPIQKQAFKIANKDICPHTTNPLQLKSLCRRCRALDTLGVSVYQMPDKLGGDWAVTYNGKISDGFASRTKAENWGIAHCGKSSEAKHSQRCPECGQERPGDERVLNGMKCRFCAY